MVRLIIIKPLTLLLICLAASPYFYFLIQNYQQQHVREEMKERLELSTLQTINITTDEVNWDYGRKEIWIEGRMFDIKSVEKSGSYYTLHGLYDNEETALVLLANERQQKQHANGSKLLAKLFQIFSSVSSGPPPMTSSYEFIVTKYNDFTITLESICENVWTPPPRC